MTLGCCISQGHDILMRQTSGKENKQPSKKEVYVAGNRAGGAELNIYLRIQMKPSEDPGTCHRVRVLCVPLWILVSLSYSILLISPHYFFSYRNNYFPPIVHWKHITCSFISHKLTMKKLPWFSKKSLWTFQQYLDC